MKRYVAYRMTVILSDLAGHFRCLSS